MVGPASVTFGGPTTDEECIRAVQRALDLGINFFDTSPRYGGGRSEENLGKGLEGKRQEVYVATKVRLQNEEERTSINRMVTAVRNSVRQSLSRLGTDYVDVLQVHHQVGSERGEYMAAVGPPPRYALLLDKEDCLALGEAMKQLNQSQGGMCIYLRRGIVLGIWQECFGP